MKIAQIFRKADKKHVWREDIPSRLCEEVIGPLTILSINHTRIILQYRKNPNLRVSDILPLLDKIERNIFRIKDATYTVVRLIRKSEG